jgi:hypothetical protein
LRGLISQPDRAPIRHDPHPALYLAARRIGLVNAQGDTGSQLPDVVSDD